MWFRVLGIFLSLIDLSLRIVICDVYVFLLRIVKMDLGFIEGREIGLDDKFNEVSVFGNVSLFSLLLVIFNIFRNFRKLNVFGKVLILLFVILKILRFLSFFMFWGRFCSWFLEM